MLKMKLEALEHPEPGDFDLNDRKVFASTVLWLEDQKIRQCSIAERSQLRKIDNLSEWESAYAQYKIDLSMPKFETTFEELNWMLGYAINLEFIDSSEQYKNINAQEVEKQQNKSIAPSMKAENLFDNMDFQNKEFIAGVRALAAKLKVPHHPNHLVQLEAVARIVNERISLAVKDRKPIVGTPFPFDKGEDVVAAQDKALDFPVRILRLLQIQSLRELQTQINETIVAVQDLTANPKTDTKLGKVGR